MFEDGLSITHHKGNRVIKQMTEQCTVELKSMNQELGAGTISSGGKRISPKTVCKLEPGALLC